MSSSSIQGSEAECLLDMSSAPEFYKYGYDNSIACWLTNYILCTCIVVLLYILYTKWEKRDRDLFQEQTRLFIMGKFIFLFISVLLAGFVHQGVFGRAGDVEDPVNSILWHVVEATLMIAGGCTCNAAHDLFVAKDNSRCNYAWYLVSFVLGLGLVSSTLWIFGTDAFAISGMLGEFLPDSMLLTNIVILNYSERLPRCIKCCVHVEITAKEDKLRLRSGLRWFVASVLVIYIGGTVQVLAGPTCGIPCPEDCMFPAPAFDHNAFFHVVQILGMILMTRGSLDVCKAVERDARGGEGVATPSKEEPLLSLESKDLRNEDNEGRSSCCCRRNKGQQGPKLV